MNVSFIPHQRVWLHLDIGKSEINVSSLLQLFDRENSRETD